MKKKKYTSPVYEGFLYAISVGIYTIAVASLMYNGNTFFGKSPGVLGLVAFLLLFVFSATIVSLLVFGKPVYLYLQGSKKEALQLLLYTIGWIFICLISILTIVLVLNA